MPGIEKMAKKKLEEQEAKAPAPKEHPWTKHIADEVFAKLGGKPAGYVKHDVIHMWDDSTCKFRMNVLVTRKRVVPIGGLGIKGDGESEPHYLSWWLVYTPGGELVTSNPLLPGMEITEEDKPPALESEAK